MTSPKWSAPVIAAVIRLNRQGATDEAIAMQLNAQYGINTNRKQVHSVRHHRGIGIARRHRDWAALRSLGKNGRWSESAAYKEAVLVNRMVAAIGDQKKIGKLVERLQ